MCVVINMYKFLQGKYGNGVDTTITIDGEKIRGVMFGNDECFDTDRFYQYLLDERGNLYECFYKTDLPLDEIDYTHPFAIEDVTEDFYC